MKFDNMPMAAVRESDGPAMICAITHLRERGLDVRRPVGNPHQIKVTEDLSYYPTTGKIVRDATPAYKQRGLDALLVILGRDNTASVLSFL